MGALDFILEQFLHVPQDHRHDCPWLSVCRGDELPCLLPGTPVYCNFSFGIAEHTGIYVGDGIVHLDGEGDVIHSAPREFLARLDGRNLAVNIYYAAWGEGRPLGDDGIAGRALAQVGTHPGYSLLSANCHGFSIGCITGRGSRSSLTLHSVERAISRAFGTRRWRWRCWGGWRRQWALPGGYSS